MTKYHVNSEGNVGVCKATVKDCPLSPAEEHFTSREEARLHAEKILAAEFSSKSTANFPKEDSLRTMAPGVPEDLEAHAAKALAAMGHLSDLERMALRGYGGFAAGVANTYLLGEEYKPYDKAPPWRESNGPTDFNSIEELQDYIQVMDSIFSSREDEERILYRGIPIYRSIHEEMERLIGEKFQPSDTEKQLEGLREYFRPGRVFEYPTYLSTSHSPEIAAERTDNIAGTKQEYLYSKAEISGIQMELKTNAGVDITGAVRDHYRLEREVVLPRNLKFKVEKLILKPQEYKTSVAGEETTFTGIAAVVQLSEVLAE